MTINNVNNTNKPQIDGQKVAQQQSQAQAQTTASGAGQSQTASQAARQDSVSLTQSAQQLAQVQKKGTEAPVNQEKVDRLKKAVSNGEYKVNPEVLAEKISRLEQQILGRGI
jgi:negative regulator of flagellin synthesis FlgM